MDFIRYLKYLRNTYLDQKLKSELSRKYGCIIDCDARIAIDYLEDVKIGKRVYIGAYTIIRVGNEPGMRNSSLVIGENTYIGELNNIRAGGGTIKIGKKC